MIPIWYFVGIEVLVAVVLYEIVISLYTGYILGQPVWKETESTELANKRKQDKKKRAVKFHLDNRQTDKTHVSELSSVASKNLNYNYRPTDFSDEFSESSEELESPLSSVMIDEESDRESDVSGVTIDISEVSAKEVEELGLQIEEDDGSVEIE